MTWLDAHRAAELSAFRQRFTDVRWAVFVAGDCSRVHPISGEMCGAWRRHGWIYCDGCHGELSRQVIDAALLRVPHTVSAMDLTDIP